MSWILTNPIRRLATNRRRVVADAGISDRTTVLEAGAGNGFFTETLAPIARKLYAVELQEPMARKLYRRLRHVTPRATVDIRVGDISGVTLPSGACDVAFLYFSFHEFSVPDDAATAIARALHGEGTVYIVEPRIEVSDTAFGITLECFYQRGFSLRRRWTTVFSHGALLQKSGTGSS